jgi:hypothetical protein
MGAVESKWSLLRNLEMRIIKRVGNRQVVLKKTFQGHSRLGSSLQCAASSFLRRDHSDPENRIFDRKGITPAEDPKGSYPFQNQIDHQFVGQVVEAFPEPLLGHR